MKPDEYADLLNLLLECERAGAKLLAAYIEELPPGAGALEPGATPSAKTGDFYRKGLSIRGLGERLEFLNRGQAWVARRIAEALPRMAATPGHKALQDMYDSHLANIARCDELQEGARAG